MALRESHNAVTVHIRERSTGDKDQSTKLTCTARVSSKQTKINFRSNRNKPKQDLFCVNLVCFSVSNLYQNNRNKQNCFETNRNNAKFHEKYPNILSFKLFGWVFCLLRFNPNIETLCFGIEAKQPKQTVSKQKEKKNKKTKKSKKTKKTKKPKETENP